MLDRLGIDPAEIRHLEDLQRLPILSKEAIRHNLHFDLMSDSHDKRQMLPISTSGTSGEPLMLYAEKTQLEMRWATALRNQEWTGYRFGDRQVRLWDMNLGRTRRETLREWLDAILTRRAVFSAIATGREGLRHAAAIVRRHAGSLVYGDAAALQLVAAALGESAVRDHRPRAIISLEQTLSAETRAVVEQAFQAPVFDRYGSREFGALAQECDAHSGYHVNADSYIVEIVRDGRPAKPGESGEILVTDLSNLCVPLIRYAIGDRATATERRCPCARGLPLIDAIQGRAAAVIIGADGRFVPATFFADLLRDYGHVIRQFQVVQAEPGTIQLHIVCGPRYSDAALQRLLERVRQHLGSDLVIDVQPVEVIAPGRVARPLAEQSQNDRHPAAG
jgi:phenylacetate-CoA ligase